MKKGFTMIELIFVIVILGILASVAIPRLAATRDDAEVVKAATNLTTLISDLGAYYTSQGKFADNLNEMTNVQFNKYTSGNEGNLAAAGNDCLKVTLNKATDVDKTENNDAYTIPAYLEIEYVGTADICKKVRDNTGVKNLLNSKISYSYNTPTEKPHTETKGEGSGETKGYVAVSGTSVVF